MQPLGKEGTFHYVNRDPCPTSWIWYTAPKSLPLLSGTSPRHSGLSYKPSLHKQKHQAALGKPNPWRDPTLFVSQRMSPPGIKRVRFLLSTLCLFSSYASASSLRFSAFLDHHSKLIFMRWDHDYNVMTFEIQFPSTGWVAFGFRIPRQLTGADVVIAGVLPDGNIYFSVSWNKIKQIQK